MEQRNSSTNAMPNARPLAQPGPCHKHDTWLVPGAELNTSAQFAAAVVDVALGTKAIASILSAHLTDLSAIASGAGDSVRTLLSDGDTQALARLAVFSLDQLYTLAESRIDHFNAQAAAGAQA